MIAGPAVFICNECIVLCVAILEESHPIGEWAHPGPERILVRMPDGSAHGCDVEGDWIPFRHDDRDYEWRAARGRVRGPVDLPIVAVRADVDDVPSAGLAFPPGVTIGEEHAHLLLERLRLGPTANAGKNPTGSSVTSAPCECRFLHNATSDSSGPFIFDAELNEFRVQRVGSDGARREFMIYHCPFCGGAAPRSRRETLFADIPSSESERLFALTRGLNTVAEAIERLGEPDEDHPTGYRITTPGKTTAFRVLRWHKLSDTAYVELVDYGPERGLRATLRGKYLGRKEDEMEKEE